MLYQFLYPLAKSYSFLGAFNVFRYITFRSLLAVVLSMIFSIILGRYFISFMADKSSVLRRFTPTTHQKKHGTPSMGGVVILLAFTLSVLINGNWNNFYVFFVLFNFWMFAMIGFADDFVKVWGEGGNGRGLSFRLKIFLLVGASLIVCFFLSYFRQGFLFYAHHPLHLDFHHVIVPFFKRLFIDLGVFYYVFVVVILVGTSNAVNLTDGLDGLAAGLSLQVLATFGVFAYVSGHVGIAEYLKVPYVDGVGELTVVVAALVGSCLGFLWHNAHPAQYFMGDTGSLALGGTIGLLAIFLKVELLLPIVGGVFVLEAFSVILQIGSYKIFGRRIFRLAPIHHHFELMGIKESKIIIRFWILGLFFILLALASLKIR